MPDPQDHAVLEASIGDLLDDSDFHELDRRLGRFNLFEAVGGVRAKAPRSRRADDQGRGMKTRVFKLIRQRSLPEAGGATMFFQTESGDRRHPPHFFQPEDVPAFQGESATFECEQRNGRWLIVSRVGRDSV